MARIHQTKIQKINVFSTIMNRVCYTKVEEQPQQHIPSGNLIGLQLPDENGEVLYLDPNDPAAQMLLQEAGITLGQTYFIFQVYRIANSRVSDLYSIFYRSGSSILKGIGMIRFCIPDPEQGLYFYKNLKTLF